MHALRRAVDRDSARDRWQQDARLDRLDAALSGHRWLLSPAALGRFLAALPAPMQLGKVEFDDGTWRTAFGCDASAATGADISVYGSWPAAIAAGAVG